MGPESSARGLGLCLDQISGSDFRFRVTTGSLVQQSMPDGRSPNFVVFVCDLGQPVPLESLRRIGAEAGVCAFLQPTPQQLLTLSELDRWSAVAWDGVQWDGVAKRLVRLAQSLQQEVQRRAFVESMQFWLGRAQQVPDRMELINPPPKWSFATSVLLDSRRGVVSVGALGSNAEFRLPMPGVQLFFDLFWHAGQWRLRAHSQDLRVRSKNREDFVSTNDELEVDGSLLRLLPSHQAQELASLSRRFGLFSTNQSKELLFDSGESPQFLSGVLRDLLASNVSGALHVTAASKAGVVHLMDGRIQAVHSGWAVGLKALERMLAWDAPRWRFNADERPEFEVDTLWLDLAQFTKVHAEWRAKWAGLRGLVPPPHLRLRVRAQEFLQQGEFGALDHLVLASVAEYGLVQEVINNCAARDVLVFEALVRFRRAGLIEVVAA